MKFRQGFVSNSSSSSFIVLGYSFEDDVLYDTESDDLIDDLYDHFCVLRGSDDGVAENTTVIGLDLYKFDECGYCEENKIYSLQDITEKLVTLRLGIQDALDIDDEDIGEPALYGGTRMC